jgi:hypothetical protein
MDKDWLAEMDLLPLTFSAHVALSTLTLAPKWDHSLSLSFGPSKSRLFPFVAGGVCDV